MGNHAGDDGHGDHDLALDRFDRHVCLSGICRSLWPQARPDLGDPGLFAVHWIDRFLDRMDLALDLQLDHPDRPRRGKSRWHADGHRNRTDQMARDGVGRSRWGLSFGLHAVLTGRFGRGATMGMAFVVLPRHRAGAAGAVDQDRHQGKSTLRARYGTDVERGSEETVRHLCPCAAVPARNADRFADLLLLSIHLARLVRMDALLPRHRTQARLPDYGHLPLNLDVLRDLRLLVLRVAVRSVWTALGYPGLHRSSRHFAHRHGLLRKPNQPILGGI